MHFIRLAATCFLVVHSFLTFSQEPTISRHEVSIEIGGLGLLYTLNYHRNFDHWQLRGGVGFISVKEQETEKELNVIVIPLDVRRDFHVKQHQFSIGFGFQNILGSGDIVSHENETDVFINPGIILGYRYNLKQRLSISLNFTPFYGTKSLTNDGGYLSLYDPLVIYGTTIHLWGGVGIGYRL